MIKRFLSVLAAITMAMMAFVGPAQAQANLAGESPENRCATARAVLLQLPTPPADTAFSAPPANPTSTPPITYTDTLVLGRGIEISAGEIVGGTRVGATFVGDVAGDLPGVLSSSVNYVPPAPGPGVTNTISGGGWALCGPWGTVFGSFAGGTVQWNADETLAEVAANMSVLGGSVNGIPVTGGAGSFGGVLDHRPLVQGLPPTVSGTLQLQASGSPTPNGPLPKPTASGALPNTGGPSLMFLVAAAAASLLSAGLLGVGTVLHLGRSQRIP